MPLIPHTRAVSNFKSHGGSRRDQFTQEDPIGLAGGLNAYGFAAGDPVSYSDPFGLCCFGSAIGNTAIRSRSRSIAIQWQYCKRPPEGPYYLLSLARGSLTDIDAIPAEICDSMTGSRTFVSPYAN